MYMVKRDRPVGNTVSWEGDVRWMYGNRIPLNSDTCGANVCYTDIFNFQTTAAMLFISAILTVWYPIANFRT